MPRIQWTDLPKALRDHLFDRVRERKIAAGERAPNDEELRRFRDEAAELLGVK